MKIELDLRRDLAKVTPSNIAELGKCSYTAPCAIGAMMTPEQREYLAQTGADGTSIAVLIADGTITVPRDQLHDFNRIQRMFDVWSDGFWPRVASMKEHYADA